MATVTAQIDDLNGEPDARTVTFSVNDKRYQIDLAHDNEKELVRILVPYLTAIGAPVPQIAELSVAELAALDDVDAEGVPEDASEKVKADAKAARAQRKAIRAWAKEAGYNLASNAPIPDEIVEEWTKAQEAA